MNKKLFLKNKIYEVTHRGDFIAANNTVGGSKHQIALYGKSEEVPQAHKTYDTPSIIRSVGQNYEFKPVGLNLFHPFGEINISVRGTISSAYKNTVDENGNISSNIPIPTVSYGLGQLIDVVYGKRYCLKGTVSGYGHVSICGAVAANIASQYVSNGDFILYSTDVRVATPEFTIEFGKDVSASDGLTAAEKKALPNPVFSNIMFFEVPMKTVTSENGSTSTVIDEEYAESVEYEPCIIERVYKPYFQCRNFIPTDPSLWKYDSEHRWYYIDNLPCRSDLILELNEGYDDTNDNIVIRLLGYDGASRTILKNATTINHSGYSWTSNVTQLAISGNLELALQKYKISVKEHVGAANNGRGHVYTPYISPDIYHGGFVLQNTGQNLLYLDDKNFVSSSYDSEQHVVSITASSGAVYGYGDTIIYPTTQYSFKNEVDGLNANSGSNAGRWWYRDIKRAIGNYLCYGGATIDRLFNTHISGTMHDSARAGTFTIYAKSGASSSNPTVTRNQMLVAGKYTIDTMPTFVPAQKPDKLMIPYTLKGIKTNTPNEDYTYMDDSGNKWIADSIEVRGDKVIHVERIKTFTFDGDKSKFSTHWYDYLFGEIGSKYSFFHNSSTTYIFPLAPLYLGLPEAFTTATYDDGSKPAYARVMSSHFVTVSKYYNCSGGTVSTGDVSGSWKGALFLGIEKQELDSIELPDDTSTDPYHILSHKMFEWFRRQAEAGHPVEFMYATQTFTETDITDTETGQALLNLAARDGFTTVLSCDDLHPYIIDTLKTNSREVK